jgi:hypothetical protein
MSRKLKTATSRQSAESPEGGDVPSGNVSRQRPSGRRSSGRKKPSHVTLPLGVRVRRKSWYLALINLAGLSLLFSVLLLYAFWQYTEETVVHSVLLAERQADQGEAMDASEDLLAVASVPTADDGELLSLGFILEKYRTASGLSEVQDVILQGNYNENGFEFRLKLLAKSPRLVSKTLEDDALKMVYSYDGETAKIKIEDAEGEMQQQVLTDLLDQQAIILEGAVLALASSQLPDMLAYTREADQTFEDQIYWAIQRRISAQVSMVHLLDTETGLERVRFVYFVHDGERQQLSLQLSDYRQQGEGKLPFAYTLKFNGKLRGEAKLDSIQLNPGLMRWMF